MDCPGPSIDTHTGESARSVTVPWDIGDSISSNQLGNTPTAEKLDLIAKFFKPPDGYKFPVFRLYGQAV